MKKLSVFFAAALLVFSARAFASDRDTIANYRSQLDAIEKDIASEQQVQKDLLKTKDLLLEGDKTNKEETAKLQQEDQDIDSSVNALEADNVTLAQDDKNFQNAVNSLKAERASNEASISAQNARMSAHNSYKPDGYDHAAVDAYNVEADQLEAKAASLNAQKAQLNVAKDRLMAQAGVLARRHSDLEQRRQALVQQTEGLDKKESDLKWAREKLNEQTLKWSEETKRNNARLDDSTAQLNALLVKISQLSPKCAEIRGVGAIDLDNLNGASEQALRCLQQLWDGASPGNRAPVKPQSPKKYIQ